MLRAVPKPIREERKSKGFKPRKAMRKKKRKARPTDDEKAMATGHNLPCVVCYTLGLKQQTPTEWHHWKVGRGSQHKTPDAEGMPLCNCHHSQSDPKGRNNPKYLAIENGAEAWEEEYGKEADYRAVARELEEMERNGFDFQAWSA